MPDTTIDLTANQGLTNLRDERARNEYINGQQVSDSILHYYKDLGFTTSQPAYDKWTAENKAYDKQQAVDQATMAKAKDSIATAQSAYDSYNMNAPSGDANSIIQNAWDQFRTGNDQLVSVNVVSRKGGDSGFGTPTWVPNSDGNDGGSWVDPPQSLDQYNVEGTYRLPQSVANSIMGNRGLYSFSSDGGLNVPVLQANGHGYNTIGQELHDTFRNAQQSLEDQFRTSQLPTVQSALDQASGQYGQYVQNKSDALAQIQQANIDLQAAQARIDAQNKLRADQLNGLREDYQKRLQTMRDLYGGNEITA